MSGRNLCFRAVEQGKSCWFLFNQRLGTPQKVGSIHVFAFGSFFSRTFRDIFADFHMYMHVIDYMHGHGYVIVDHEITDNEKYNPY